LHHTNDNMPSYVPQVRSGSIQPTVRGVRRLPRTEHTVNAREQGGADTTDITKGGVGVWPDKSGRAWQHEVQWVGWPGRWHIRWFGLHPAIRCCAEMSLFQKGFTGYGKNKMTVWLSTHDSCCISSYSIFLFFGCASCPTRWIIFPEDTTYLAQMIGQKIKTLDTLPR